MTLRSLSQGLVALLPLFALACGDSPDAASAESHDPLSFKTAVERSLAEPMAVPTGTPIGRELDAVAAEKVVSISPKRSESRDGERVCTTLDYVAAAGRWQRFRCTAPAEVDRVDVLRLYPAGSRTPTLIYADGNGDGRVDRFSDDGEGASLVALEDENYDGRVDRMIESVASLPDFAFDRYPGCEVIGELANRILEDRNRDGRFETESVTAKASTRSWLRCY